MFPVYPWRARQPWPLNVANVDTCLLQCVRRHRPTQSTHMWLRRSYRHRQRGDRAPTSVGRSLERIFLVAVACQKTDNRTVFCVFSATQWNSRCLAIYSHCLCCFPFLLLTNIAAKSKPRHRALLRSPQNDSCVCRAFVTSLWSFEWVYTSYTIEC